ncbi:MAG: type II toxin-antitoxin system RelE/ParE family toxin [Pontimonas sp.]
MEGWLSTLAPRKAERMIALLKMLATHGPQLGRPCVGKCAGSRHSHTKELRLTGPNGPQLRVLWCFDSRRRAVMLRAGDKTGQWDSWYTREIPVADAAFDEYRRTNNE